ncbi:MAG TPA: glycine--tRNA ligase subunit beta [Synergistetes bacterium]|nr:glycine--tRNA ligase subunit beta [Synergistota bacterium]
MPKDSIGAILGICDRVDTITGGFKAGLQPTGSQDPYGIRRASRTLNEILWGSGIDADLVHLVTESARQRELSEEESSLVMEFIFQRLHNQLREKGFSHELTTLAVSVAGSRPMQAMRMLDVFSKIQDSEWFLGLVVSAVRVKNILQKVQENNGNLDSELLTEKEEKELFEIVEALSPDVGKAVEESDWDSLARLLARLEPFITAFFDHVLVMDKDENVRRNRIALLEKCNDLFRTAGDLGVLKS